MKPDIAPELGILNLALVPALDVRFRISSARSLHAALLRRLELITPDLSSRLHNSLMGDHSTEHPITVSQLEGHLYSDGFVTVAQKGTTYKARVAALTSDVARILDLAFYHRHPLGQEPLVLENIPFEVVLEDTYWDNLATYGSLLTMAKPRREIALEFCSPTGFRTRLKSPVSPDPAICISGYLRKWNAFAKIPLAEEPLMAFVQNHIVTSSISINPAIQRMGDYSEYGFIGRVKWKAESGSPALLRQVNALVEFACYCGTGMKTAIGMGQTRRTDVDDSKKGDQLQVTSF